MKSAWNLLLVCVGVTALGFMAGWFAQPWVMR